ncbi:hypothetical protein QA648_05255 [Rhizobium sp. CB3171]|uniref:hypothetical protein n=1 Tax=unclassified Rhizobium TaxID=2613769 RepID=UPI000CDF42AB|nr:MULTISPECIES: hypothetical protein [Rhizobium]AVA21205.1 hypothetical protein NXC24_CH01549 [Rhizobium sp. NXC24]MDK4739330.1 hypothetical protein [Rhizobium sp. CNPSo 3464]UWU22377.1 hypothetical protein N2601_05240 [Rhizobium tropici]WFU03173.1 hypothetical protein QA648_05255 [Rhizobium sp. CB3171]
MREVLKLIVLGLPFAVMADAPALAGQDCYCKNVDGKQHAIGEVACMTVNGKSYLAQCEMNLNVTSWLKLQDGCPITERSPTLQSAWRPQPIAVR